MTRFLNLLAAEPDISLLPLMLDSLEVERHRGRLEMRAGQMRRQFHLPQGRRGEIPSTGPAKSAATAPPPSSWPSTNRARPPPRNDARSICLRAFKYCSLNKLGLPPERHHLRPQHPDRRHRHGGAQPLRARFHRGHSLRSKPNLPRHPHFRRHQQHFIFLSRQQRRCAKPCTPLPLPRHQGRTRHGHRQRRHDRRLRRIPKDLLELVEDVLLNRRPDATERLVTFAEA